MMPQNNSRDFQVLAKSKPEITLCQHIDDCVDIEKQLIDCFPNIPVVDKKAFWEVLRVALCFHDTGKSHKDFQKLLCGRKNAWCGKRHELFSLNFLIQADLRKEIKDDALFAVCGHHKDIDTLLRIIKEYDLMRNDVFVSYSQLSWQDDCKQLLVNKTWKVLRQYGFEKKTDDTIDVVDYIHSIARSKPLWGKSEYIAKLLLLGFVKECDHLASAGIEKIYKLDQQDFLFLYKYPHYTHQIIAKKSDGNVFLIAPTGSGKTETSLLWLQRQLCIKGQARVYYILPYTASINAMYERLHKEIDVESGVNKVGMLHGKLAQYINNKFENSEDFSVADRLLEDFKTLVTPLKIVTPFQLLKYLFGIKGFEKGLAELSGGYFIFDEIHAYDNTTFAQIVVLLEFCVQKLLVNVFVMSATMPSFMLNMLNEAVGKKSVIKADRQLYDTFNRHCVYIEEGLLIDNLDLIQKDIDSGLSVLVVCNTVEQAQEVYSNLYCDDKLLLHGAFNATDRAKKEKTLQSENITLLVGTQAIEVSLDIDYDTIYTEPAPIDALIQRFGRVNRKRKKGICPCHVFSQSTEKDRFVYNQEVVERSIDVLDMIGRGGIIGEKNVQKMIDLVYPSWNEEQQNEYIRAYECLKVGMESCLYPMHYDEKNEQAFYSMFDGVKVLPVCLLDSYKNYLSMHQYIKADGLMVSVRESRFAFMIRKGEIESLHICIEAQNEEIEEKKVYVINKEYDYEMGLQIGKDLHLIEDSFL